MGAVSPRPADTGKGPTYGGETGISQGGQMVKAWRRRHAGSQGSRSLFLT